MKHFKLPETPEYKRERARQRVDHLREMIRFHIRNRDEYGKETAAPAVLAGMQKEIDGWILKYPELGEK